MGSGTGVLESCRTVPRPRHDLTPQAELRGHCSPTGAQGLDTNEPHYLLRPMSIMTGCISQRWHGATSFSQALHKMRALAGRFCAAALPYAPRPRPYHADSSSRPASWSSLSSRAPYTVYSRPDKTHAPFFTLAPLAIGSTADAMNA